MKFRITEIENKPVAIFNSGNPLRNRLLSQFLVSSKYFVVDILHDISMVERGIYPSYAFENPTVYVELFKDRITIEPYIEEHETQIPGIELPLDSAKLLLFRWGLVLQQWQMRREKSHG